MVSSWAGRPARLSWLALLVAVALLLVADVAAAQGKPSTRIHVRGAAEIHAVATIARDELTLHGEVIDDAGTPIAAAPVVVTISSGAAGAQVTGLRACDTATRRGAAKPVENNPSAFTIETDDRGGFCVIGHASVAKSMLALRFPGKGLYDAAEASVPVEEAEEHRARVVLRFEPPIEAIDLDRDAVLVTATLRVDRSDTARALAGVAGSAQRASLQLALTDERGAHVAEALTGGDGRARFEIKTSALAGPGAGELTVHFAGNAVLESATWSQPVVRRAEARLSLSHPIAPADSEDGATIDVDVAAGPHPVEGGVVDVQRVRPTFGGHEPGPPAPAGEESGTVTAGTVDARGHARIVASFPSAGAAHATLVLRYLPAAPWYRAGPALQVDVPLVRSGVGRTVLLAMLVIAAGTWVLIGWRRAPPRPLEPGAEPSAGVATGVPGVRVVASSADRKGWAGTVIDAHDGSPVPSARVSIVAPAFAGDGVRASTIADDKGAFALGPTDAQTDAQTDAKDARLIIESDEHAKHEQPLPPPSVVVVALITRRRALLERLVRWARRRGAPFDAPADATPGHVRRVAARSRDDQVEAWATRMEEAVYGQERVDATVERDVRDREPRAPS